jgi:bacillithiol biosynthesis cysteine-adding enzyme BshC
MKISEIPYSEISILPSLVKDFISGNLPEEINVKYPTWADIECKIKEKQQFLHRDILVQTINKQYLDILPENKVNENINSLLQKNTFTVTTGHQLCIFLGPLYVVYKILHCIKLANELNQKFNQYHFVPVFWMASEDHDTQEINHIFLKGNKIEWSVPSAVTTGSLKTESLKEIIDSISKLLGINTESNSIISVFEKAYLQHNNLANATRFLINELFGSYGIVVIDGDSPVLKQVFSPILKKEVNENFIEKIVSNTNHLIANNHYKVQANPRTCNSFLIKENKRFRLEKEENKFYAVNSTDEFTKEELLKLIDEKPEMFSPNVLMRPLFQETVLPNIASIGGAGETAYWLQLKNVFKEISLPFPLLFLRASFVLLNEKDIKAIEKTTLNLIDFFEEEEALIKTYLQNNNIEFKSESQYLQAFFKELKQKTLQVDISMEMAVNATIHKIKGELENLEKKIVKAMKQKNETQINQLKKSREKIFPQNKMQERTENFLSYSYPNNSDLFAKIYKEIDVSGKNITVLKCL